MGFCSGIISGLVGITPAAGFVPVFVAALVGFLTSICCFYTKKYSYFLSVDEGLDIWAIHGIGGYVGDILTGLFAASFVPALDGVTGDSNPGGWWERNWVQLGYQFAAATTCAAWSFVVSCILLFIIGRIPGLHLRASEEDEIRGLDYKYFDDADCEWFGDNNDMALQGVQVRGTSERQSEQDLERTATSPAVEKTK